MRLGVFGGSFDPVHLGHLILAEQCREQAGLDEVLFVPTARHPLKTDRQYTPFDVRVEMLRLAVGDRSEFRIDELENERPGLSFTADTLAILKQRRPGAELLLLLGSDCLPELPQWREPERIVDRAELVVMERPGSPALSAEQLRALLKLASPPRLRRVEVPLIDIASRDIRRRVGAGRSVRYLVPDAVEAFIRARGLYV